MSWLRLIRWKNLLIIFFMQFIAWWCVILPNGPEILAPLNFSLITISTVSIAAAGYIINDYFDIKIDAINHPDSLILEKLIPRKHAIISHAVLNLVAIALAGIVALRAHHPQWVSFQLICISLLWFYSTRFKRQYLIGNLVVALLASSTILVLVVYEPWTHTYSTILHHHICACPVINEQQRHQDKEGVFLFYAYFAFMLTWMREIVKDMEDLKGDQADGCMTMPIKRGLEYATRFTVALSCFVILSLILVAAFTTNCYLTLPFYLVGLFIIPLVLWTISFIKNARTQQYHKASRTLKIIMVIGICSLLVYHFLLF